MTEAERLDLIERAAAAGYASLSQYARVMLLQSHGRADRRTAPARGIFSADDRRALVNIGNNLNQIARVMNAGRDHALQDDLAAALAELHQLYDRYLPA